jgi:RNA polymerase sigma-70 factor (ECF subfamily)
LKSGFEQLIESHSRQVLNTALRVLGDRQKAMDVHQEVFLAIWRRWPKFNGQTKWDGYLYRATVRKAIDLAKKTRNERIAAQEFESPATGETPDTALRLAEMQKKLANCLTKLPKRQAEVFVLSRIEGLKAEEIAQILGCSQETVRVHLHRATKKLAEQLGDYLAR